jgi:hypothetical protein
MGKRVFNLAETTPERRQELAASFAGATPFPHLVLNDVISLSPESIVAEFPEKDWDGWTDLGGQAWQRGKQSCSDIEIIPDLPARMLREMNDPSFLKFIEDVTGLRGLLADPYFEGGGMHLLSAGGKLSAHTDFHLHESLNVFRRINVLIYLNNEWQSAYGGELRLALNSSPTVPAVTVAPTFGTCVIFQTDDNSPHGVSPVTDGSPPRRSLAAYYYTSSEADRFSGDAFSHWREHDSTVGLRNHVRLGAFKASVRLSRKISQIAYRLNPNRS